jgi:hypothetical protein
MKIKPYVFETLRNSVADALDKARSREEEYQARRKLRAPRFADQDLSGRTTENDPILRKAAAYEEAATALENRSKTAENADELRANAATLRRAHQIAMRGASTEADRYFLENEAANALDRAEALVPEGNHRRFTRIAKQKPGEVTPYDYEILYQSGYSTQDPSKMVFAQDKMDAAARSRSDDEFDQWKSTVSKLVQEPAKYKELIGGIKSKEADPKWVESIRSKLAVLYRYTAKDEVTRKMIESWVKLYYPDEKQQAKILSEMKAGK